MRNARVVIVHPFSVGMTAIRNFPPPSGPNFPFPEQLMVSLTFKVRINPQNNIAAGFLMPGKPEALGNDDTVK
jgi:hypothetical protein